MHTSHTETQWRCNMTNKTPYELRFDLLTFSRDTLETEYHAKIERVRWQADYNTRFPSSAKAVEDTPEYPNKDKIFSLAEEFKKFIEQK